jgi:hypothetical protein
MLINEHPEDEQEGEETVFDAAGAVADHIPGASVKLRDWYMQLWEYKKPGLVRTGLRMRIPAEIYHIEERGISLRAGCGEARGKNGTV